MTFTFFKKLFDLEQATGEKLFNFLTISSNNAQAKQ
tara:strand:- start:2679 stop:2786 length:108 start_codon:yes stop_codon:yes gene_type:complete